MACIIVTLSLHLNNGSLLKRIVSLTIISGCLVEHGQTSYFHKTFSSKCFIHTLEFCVTTKLSRGIFFFHSFRRSSGIDLGIELGIGARAMARLCLGLDIGMGIGMGMRMGMGIGMGINCS